jgi:hypothetical protein
LQFPRKLVHQTFQTFLSSSKDGEKVPWPVSGKLSNFHNLRPLFMIAKRRGRFKKSDTELIGNGASRTTVRVPWRPQNVCVCVCERERERKGERFIDGLRVAVLCVLAEVMAAC